MLQRCSPFQSHRGQQVLLDQPDQQVPQVPLVLMEVTVQTEVTVQMGQLVRLDLQAQREEQAQRGRPLALELQPPVLDL